MKYIYQITIISLLLLMSYEFWFFTQHYNALLGQLEIVKKACKIDIGQCDDGTCEFPKKDF